MALRGALTHRKTRKLARALGVDPCYALGLMEALWHVAGEQVPPDGGVGRMSDDDLAMEMHSTLEGGLLVEALTRAGLLEEDGFGESRLIVHDWHEHADDAVKLRLARNTQRFANGAWPQTTRLKQDQRDSIQEKYVEKYGLPTPGGPNDVCAQKRTDAHPMRFSAHKSALPEPEPEPEPVRSPQPPPGAVRRVTCRRVWAFTVIRLARCCR